MENSIFFLFFFSETKVTILSQIWGVFILFFLQIKPFSTQKFFGKYSILTFNAFVPIFPWAKMLQITSKNNANFTLACWKKIMNKFHTLPYWRGGGGKKSMENSIFFFYFIFETFPKLRAPNLRELYWKLKIDKASESINT